mgnify:CR=1 FL=1
MNIIDYTGKINNHEEYIKILDKIKPICKYIEIVVIDGKENNELVDKFSEYIIDTKKVSKWWGNETSIVNNLYKIRASEEFFDYLKKYETFCKYYEYGTTKESLTRGDYSEITNFGYDDIAFYDEFDNYLLFTTTHEGNIAINDKILKGVI